MGETKHLSQLNLQRFDNNQLYKMFASWQKKAIVFGEFLVASFSNGRNYHFSDTFLSRTINFPWIRASQTVRWNSNPSALAERQSLTPRISWKRNRLREVRRNLRNTASNQHTLLYLTVFARAETFFRISLFLQFYRQPATRM